MNEAIIGHMDFKFGPSHSALPTIPDLEAKETSLILILFLLKIDSLLVME